MINRDIENKIVDSLNKKEITVITGARQVGKTTILKRIMSKLIGSGKKVLYFNLDIEQDNQYFVSQLLLISKIQLENGDGPSFVFIDEIQQKEDAGRFLKGLYDMNLPYKFVVTGSGSLGLKEKISEALTGRKYLIEMYPVSFSEFVNYKTNYKYKSKLEFFFEIEKERTNLLLHEYLTFGGYPAVITSDNVKTKKEVMNEIFSSYITKDITYLLGVRAPDKFVKLIQLLAIYSGSVINYSQLAQETGLRTETLKTYLWYAEQTFIINIIKPYFTNNKKEITKSPTIYFNDLGMCNFSKGMFGATINSISGMTFQNFVYLILKDNIMAGLAKVNYWRSKDKAEVDFIIHQQNGITPVEVKYSNIKKTTVSRSFRSFINNYSPKTGYIISPGFDATIIIGETKVQFLSFWKLILHNDKI
ncbi:MAG: ATP-binding protein [Draconibacterium sp.]|nr:ATP-binding protein [Draconibacterium sp.]